MTMIIGAITPDSVFMVSDRRVTVIGTGELMTDHENKMVVLAGEMVLGYTGLACLDGVPTHEWVVNTLRTKRDPSKYLPTLIAEGERAIKAACGPRPYRHSFLLVGWSYRPSIDGYAPIAVEIGNTYDEMGQLLPTPSSKFTARRYTLGNAPCAVFSVGALLSSNRRNTLQRTVSRYHQATPNRAQGVIELLATEIHNTAARSKTVGRELLAASFPRIAVRSGVTSTFDSSDDAWNAQLTTMYIGTDSRSVQYAPS